MTDLTGDHAERRRGCYFRTSSTLNGPHWGQPTRPRRAVVVDLTMEQSSTESEEDADEADDVNQEGMLVCGFCGVAHLPSLPVSSAPASPIAVPSSPALAPISPVAGDGAGAGAGFVTPPAQIIGREPGFEEFSPLVYSSPVPVVTPELQRRLREAFLHYKADRRRSELLAAEMQDAFNVRLAVAGMNIEMEDMTELERQLERELEGGEEEESKEEGEQQEEKERE